MEAAPGGLVVIVGVVAIAALAVAGCAPTAGDPGSSAVASGASQVVTGVVDDEPGTADARFGSLGAGAASAEVERTPLAAGSASADAGAGSCERQIGTSAPGCESAPRVAASGGPDPTPVTALESTTGAGDASLETSTTAREPPGLPGPRLNRSSGVVGEPGAATVQHTVSYERLPDVDGEVRVRRAFDVPEGVDSLRVGFWSSERVVSADGFEQSGTFWEWTGSTRTPTVTIRRELVRATEAEGDGWAVVARADPSWAASGTQRPDFSTTVQSPEPGTIGSGLVVLGEHEEYVRSTPEREIRVVIPSAVSPTASPPVVADALAAVARDRPIDTRRDSSMLVAVGADSTDWRGAASDADAIVRADQGIDGPSTWFHEFAHLRQSFNASARTQWLVEGYAEYAQYRAAARQGRLGVDGYRSGLRSGQAGTHSDVVLADRSTWRDTMGDYERGALALHALDAELHRYTGGTRDLRDVLARLNRVDSGSVQDQQPVSHDRFVEVVRSVSGDGPASLADRLATSSTQPSVADRATIEEMLGQRSSAALTFDAAASDLDRRWLRTDDARARFGTVRRGVPVGDGPAPDRTVRVDVLLYDVRAFLRGFDLEVVAGNASVVAIEDASLGPAFDGGGTATVAGGERATLRYGGSVDFAASGAVNDGGIVLATLEVSPTGAGTTRLSPVDASLRSSDGSLRLYDARTARLRVERQPVPEIDGATPRDVNRDGLYRDLTGDGTVDHADVVTFFQSQHRSPVQDNEILFDFTGNGGASHGDVVALFEHVAASL